MVGARLVPYRIDDGCAVAAPGRMRYARRMTRALWFVVLLAGSALADPAPCTAKEQTVGGVRFLLRYCGGADDNAPLIVAIHGKGAIPEHMARVYEQFDERAEFAVPVGPTPFEKGFEWFDWPKGVNEDEAAPRVSAAAEHLWAAIAALAHGRKVILTGFSQGAILDFVLAAAHPEGVLEAIPVSGRSLKPLYPKVKPAPVFAIHGGADKQFDVRNPREAVAAHQAMGGQAQLHEVPGVDHTFGADVQILMMAEIHRVLEQGPLTSPGDNEAVVRKFWDAFNRAAWGELDALVTPGYQHHPPGKTATLAQLKEGGAFVHKAMSEYHLELDSAVASSNTVAVRWTAKGKHTGSFFGEKPTKRELVVHGMTFHELFGDKINADWEVIDFDGLKQQLGKK